ncbi:MAG: XRE family transcriptional regulator, partial [Ethanoligenens sp.]
IILCNSHIICIDGERGEDKLLKPETVSIHINPVLAKYTRISINNNQKSLTTNDFAFHLASPLILPSILKWEKMHYLYTSSCKEAGNNPNDATKAAIAKLLAIKESVELELQCSMVLLDTSAGIKVKIPPEF